MVKRKRYSKIEKLCVLREIWKNHLSISEVAIKYEIHYTTIEKWLYHCETFGFERLKNFSSRKSYTNEEKLKAILAVVEGNMSIRQATKTFQISSPSVLSNWILSYTNGETLKTTSKGCSSNMTIKGRDTTYQERIEMVQHTLANDLNYKQAMETYGISYHQIYTWVKKYQQQGEQGLKDRRGQNKSSNSLTEEERLKLRIKELETRNNYLEMENVFAKKLQEIQRNNKN